MILSIGMIAPIIDKHLFFNSFNYSSDNLGKYSFKQTPTSDLLLYLNSINSLTGDIYYSGNDTITFFNTTNPYLSTHLISPKTSRSSTRLSIHGLLK